MTRKKQSAKKMAAVKKVSAHGTPKKRSKKGCESSSWLGIVFEAAPDALLAVDRNGLIAQANSNVSNLFGYDSVELQGQPVDILIPASKRPGHERSMKSFFADPSQRPMGKNLGLTAQRKDGSQFPVDISLNTMTFDGQVYALAAIRDITAQKESQESVHRSEVRFQKMFRSSPLPMTLGRVPDGEIVDVNDKFCEAFGYCREEILGKNVVQIGLIEDNGVRERIMALLQTGGHVRDQDVRIRTRAGEERDILYSADVIELDGQKYALASAQDITERKNSEQELRRSADRFRSLLEALPVAARVIQNEEIVFSNSADARMYGYAQPEEILGRGVVDFIAPEEKDRVRDIVSRRLKGDPTVPERYESIAIRADGSKFPVALSATVITYEGGPAALSVLEDLTERKRLQMYESILPVCSLCGKVRDDSETDHGKGDWNTLEQYISDHTETALSHTFCPICLDEYRESQGMPPAPQKTNT